MAEPHTTAASAAAGIPPAIGLSLPLTVLGASVEAMLLGLVAAVLSAVMLEAIDKPGKAFAGVLFASLLSGFGSPAAADWVVAHVSGLSNAPLLAGLMAIVIGALAPPLMAPGIERLKRMVGGAP